VIAGSTLCNQDNGQSNANCSHPTTSGDGEHQATSRRRRRGAAGPPRPNHQPGRPTQRTRQGPPDPAIHPTDRNRNLAITPSRRTSGLAEGRGTTRSEGLLASSSCSSPILAARAVDAAVSRVERSDIAKRRDEGAPLTRQHRPLRRSKNRGKSTQPTQNDDAKHTAATTRDPEHGLAKRARASAPDLQRNRS
jgi:hypothetical protein